MKASTWAQEADRLSGRSGGTRGWSSVLVTLGFDQNDTENRVLCIDRKGGLRHSSAECKCRLVAINETSLVLFALSKGATRWTVRENTFPSPSPVAIRFAKETGYGLSSTANLRSGGSVKPLIPRNTASG